MENTDKQKKIYNRLMKYYFLDRKAPKKLILLSSFMPVNERKKKKSIKYKQTYDEIPSMEAQGGEEGVGNIGQST